MASLPPIVNTSVLLATIADLTRALEAEIELSDRNAALAAKYKTEAEQAEKYAALAERYRDALENIERWVVEGFKS